MMFLYLGAVVRRPNDLVAFPHEVSLCSLAMTKR